MRKPEYQPTIFDGLATPESKVGSLRIESGSQIGLQPIDGTFQDSGTTPYQSWYPYLEGFSRRFVDRVRASYFDNARSIYEPFAGTGTTPIVLAQQGVSCGYSEANPAMVNLIETKIAALQLSTDRRQLASSLREVSKQLEGLVALADPDAALANAYNESFGPSVFFEDNQFEAILKLRSINDAVVHEFGKLPSDCLAIAVMASLIPSSYLKRAGDVRYKTQKELSRGLPAVVTAVSDRLLKMAIDIEGSDPIVAGVTRLGFDARSIELDGHIEQFGGLITSPPYLNGTNYIRNTKLELWYGRYVESKSDLRKLRDGVVTAGINDVSENTSKEYPTNSVEGLVEAVSKVTYDARIPRMIGGYFADMADFLATASRVLRPGAKVAIDIGDSIYAGVHVQTDRLLVDTALELGFVERDSVIIRERRSKDGSLLKQTLLVLEAPPRPVSRIGAMPALKAHQASNRYGETLEAWGRFKSMLPHRTFPYSKRNWGDPRHSLCSYQGKLKPSIAHHLIRVFSRPGDVVVDPFSGAGTIPLEAAMQGRRAVGIDIARLAYILTRAKLSQPNWQEIAPVLDDLETALRKDTPSPDDLEAARKMDFNSAIPDYFHPETLSEVLVARRYFIERWDTSDAWAIVYAACLHILHGNRPYALSRKSHPITPFAPTGPMEYRPLIPRLRSKLARTFGTDSSKIAFSPGTSRLGDCTKPWGLLQPANAIITSPPFFDSTRFYMANWMRYWFTGWEREDFSSDRVSDFVESRQKRSMGVYRDFFSQAAQSMHRGAYMVLHLGLSKKSDMAQDLLGLIPTEFELVDLFYESVHGSDKHGLSSKGAVSSHSYLVLVRT